jgi:lipopolysaccharide/colanic/teichoic acid biosynthesis glycosyltransferase
MNGFYLRYGKRLLDLAIALPAAILLLPVMAFTAMVVFFSLGCPIIFWQRRVGHGGRIFELCKFRSMLDAQDDDGRALPDAQRLTATGRWLRWWCLDELPQLWHVLRGEMSLVGPRPLLEQYLARYTPRQARRHEVLPGVTGWAQVNGRNAISWEERFERDVWYVDHAGFILDLKILALTLAAVLRRRGVSHHDHPTMPEFMGSAGDG